MRPVIEQNLKSDVALRDSSHQDARIRRPIGPRFDQKLEIAGSFVGDQIRPQPRAGRILTSDDDAVFDSPAAKARTRQLARLCRPASQ
jgi:hypothetical protein